MQDLDEDDLVRKTDLLIQQLAAARATCGVPDTFAASSSEAATPAGAKAATSAAGADARSPPAASSGLDVFDPDAASSYSIPSEVTFGINDGGSGVGEEAASHGSTKGGATLSTASTSFHAAEFEGGDSSSSDDDDDYSDDNPLDNSSDFNHYQDSMPDVGANPTCTAVDAINELAGVISTEVTPSSPPDASQVSSESPTQLKKKIMSKYGEGTKMFVTKEKQKKTKKEKKGSGSRKPSKKGKRATSGKTNKSSSRNAGSSAADISVAAYAHRKQREQEYGADYSASTSQMAPQTQRRSPATQPATTAVHVAAQPTTKCSYQTTTDQSLQEAMRHAEIAEDAARRMREAVATHSGQTMDRDGQNAGMQGLGSEYPQGFGNTGSGGPRVGKSFLETGATACIREMLRCLADPLQALANDNSAPPGSSVSGFGSMDDPHPHPRFARARGSYVYVPVPNVRHVGGIDAGKNADSDMRQNSNEQSSSERKGLLERGTGYDSSW